MRIIAVIQARMGSSRLPGKVLRDIWGEGMLARVVQRARRAAGIDAVMVATTTEPVDQAIATECGRLAVPCFRGASEDVLDRYYQLACRDGADAIVRITSDCPLLDPRVVESVVAAFRTANCDYVSNTLERTYPRGLDAEVFTAAALARAWREARRPHERVHVTPYVYQNPRAFRLLSVISDGSYGGHRWTVDTPEDLEFARAIYARLAGENDFGWREVLAVLDREPGLSQMNSDVPQKTLEEC